MGETVGDLQYTDREALHLGADYYPDAGDPRYQTEVLLVDAANLGEDDDAPDKNRAGGAVGGGAHPTDVGRRLPGDRQGHRCAAPRSRPGTSSSCCARPKPRRGVFHRRASSRRAFPRARRSAAGLLETAEVGTMVVTAQHHRQPAAGRRPDWRDALAALWLYRAGARGHPPGRPQRKLL